MKKTLRLTTILMVSVSMCLPAMASKSNTFTVNPSTIKTRLLNANASVLIGLNQVYKAKEEVNVARGNLLPSINASAMLSAGGVFSLTAISFLVPFLLPSNWYNLDVSQHLLVADGHAYHLVQLNQYASAYALYTVLLSDRELRHVYIQRVQASEKIRDVLQARVEMGLAVPADLDRAIGEVQLARAQVSQIESMLNQQNASLRKMLGLPLKSRLVYQTVRPPSLPQESWSAQKLLNHVHGSSPEVRQIHSLIKASESATWSRAFSFLSGASVVTPVTNGHAAFGDSYLQGSASIGFAYFPTLKLSHLGTREYQLRRYEIRLEQARVIETTLGSLRSARTQLASARQAELHMTKAFEARLEAFRTGVGDLLSVIDASNGVTNAALSRIKAQADLDGHRISLARVLITGPFGTIRKCDLRGIEDMSPGLGWLTDLFGGESNRISVDRICAPKKSSRATPLKSRKS